MDQPAARGEAPPLGAPRRIGDFDHLVQCFRSWQGRFEQLSFGRFEGAIRVARGRHVHALMATTNQALRVRGREPLGVMTIALVTQRSARCVWQGRQLDAGQVVVLGGDVEADHQTSKDAVNVQFSVREDRFRRAVVRETGDDPGPMGWRAALTAPAAFARLEAATGRLLDEPSARPDAGDAAERACVRAAVAALFPSDGSALHSGLSVAARDRLVRRAEEVMRHGLRAAVTEDDLCRELGVRGRTLRLAFRERFGMGPMAYLQSLRLNAVRATLKATARADMSVAGVARELGFHHPGKFAGYYCRLFGELPSQTVARRRPVLARVGG